MAAQTDIERAQRVRMRRFGMSVATFVVVALSTVLITSLGRGRMTGGQWSGFIAFGLVGVAVFFTIFRTNTNLRFSEPSLAREQIVFWSFWGLFAMYWMPDVRPIIFLYYLPPFSFGILALNRRQYLVVVAWVMGMIAGLLALEYYRDPQAFDVRYQLFLFTLFGILLTWFAFFGGYVSNIRRRLRGKKNEAMAAHSELQAEMAERQRVQVEKDALIVELREALENVKLLRGLLPICASCKRIRDDSGYWNQIESYLATHTEVEFTHGICPDCAQTLYPEVFGADDSSE